MAQPFDLPKACNLNQSVSEAQTGSLVMATPGGEHVQAAEENDPG